MHLRSGERHCATLSLVLAFLLLTTCRTVTSTATDSSSTADYSSSGSTCSPLSQPLSLAGNPTKVLVPPGTCQFHDDWTPVPLLQRVAVSPTSYLLRFGLPDASAPLNLSTCACILARASIQQDEEEDVVRPYTPVSTNAQVGSFDLLIKDYGPTSKMPRHLTHGIQVGDKVAFKHIGFNVKVQAPFRQKKIAMLVGGTGITPMIQALHAILGGGDDDSQQQQQQNQVVMLYGSKVADDILGRTMIDTWAEKYSDQFKVVHILSNEGEDTDWTGLRGYIDRELLATYLPPPSIGDDLIIFVCGPPPMYNALCGPRQEEEISGLLANMGYKKDQVYKF